MNSPGIGIIILEHDDDRFESSAAGGDGSSRPSGDSQAIETRTFERRRCPARRGLVQLRRTSTLPSSHEPTSRRLVLDVLASQREDRRFPSMKGQS